MVFDVLFTWILAITNSNFTGKKRTLSLLSDKLQLAILHTLCEINKDTVDISQNMFVEGNNIYYRESAIIIPHRVCYISNCNLFMF